ncbi:MAG TPA: CBASS cGAMP-activated phospholipase [Bryobacteraceae bacterium]|nr:CBASS cGAMP-activated phospholipase [Bryobacteraceae bacterium]
MRSSKGIVKILSIDGGGIRGIIPAIVLAEIEKRTGRAVSQLFDLVAGTSTGGILALGLTIPKIKGAPLYTAQNLVEMYEREGRRIFSRSLLRKLFACDNLTWKKYSSTGIEQVLLEYFGDSRLRDAATEVLITSYEVERRFPFFFKSCHARERLDYDFPARAIARATSAAPTYFEPMKLFTGTNSDHYTLIDGGVFANNPAACALVEARTMYPDASAYLMVSLGTGALVRSLPLSVAKYWGSVRWAKPLIDIVFDGVSSTVDYQLRELVRSTPSQSQLYYRFQVQLNGHDSKLDNTSPRNITALKALGCELVERESEDIAKLCEKLVKDD